MAGNKWKGKECGNKEETEDLSSIQNKNNGRRKLGKVIIHIHLCSHSTFPPSVTVSINRLVNEEQTCVQ